MRFAWFFTLLICISACQHNVPGRTPSSETALTPRFSLDKISDITNKHTLVITHATKYFDQDQSAKAGIDELVRTFKSKNLPVVYLVSDQSAQGYSDWYTSDRSPDFEVFSEGGEHNLPVRGSEITIAGGFFGSTDTLNGCQTLAMKDAIRMHFETSKSPLTIHVPIKATYFYDEWKKIRESLLTTGTVDLKAYKSIPYPFASVFFLREGNDGAGDDGNEQFFAHYYTGHENKTYRRGEEVSREKYQFNFYVNDKLLESVRGRGSRLVNIKLETR